MSAETLGDPADPASRGDWLALNSGVRWFIMDPRPEDVRIEDIAHGLSHVCRFGGHCREFYSVAQHSTHVANIIGWMHPSRIDWQLYGLLHDASEAFLGDMVRPLKLNMPAYKALELRTEDVIWQGLNFTVPGGRAHDVMKWADDVALMTERRDLVNHCGHDWTPRAEPHPFVLHPWSPTKARRRFLRHYFSLVRAQERFHRAIDRREERPAEDPKL